MEIIGYLAAILIGISLGLIGAGGSILTVPILVYLFQIKPELAVSYSLFIVGLNSMLGAFQHYRLGNLHLKSAMYFAIPSVFSLLLSRKFLLPIIPDHLGLIGNIVLTKNLLLMLVFALLMMLASVSMIRNKKIENHNHKTNFAPLFIVGILVGFVTGFLGAGGGFLIIPALIFFAGIPMKQAVGTSLLIIFINSLIGFSSDLMNGVQLDISFLVIISSIALTGILIGIRLSKKISGNQLRPAFGWFVLVMGVYIIAKETILK